jgi:hypothetical protein
MFLRLLLAQVMLMCSIFIDLPADERHETWVDRVTMYIALPTYHLLLAVMFLLAVCGQLV